MQAELPAAVEENLVEILQKCRHAKNLQYGRRLLAYLQQGHLESHTVLGNFLVPMLVECGALHDAQHVFDKLAHINEHSWTSLISGYISNGEPQRALHIYHRMQQEASVQPSRYTYLALLNACARLEDVNGGQAIHAEVTKRGFDKELHMGSTILDMYAKYGLLSEACQVFDRLPGRDVVTWAAIIAGFAEQGLCEEAASCLHQMQSEGVSPDAVTFLCILKACCTIGTLEVGRELHDEITKRGLEKQLYVGSTLVDMYIKCRSLIEAWQVFNDLPVRSVVTWNALIAGYIEHGRDEEAWACYQQMLVEGTSPSEVTFIHGLKASGARGALDKGQTIHADIVKRGLERVLRVGTTLVHMYTICSSVAEANQVFDRLLSRNAVSWSAAMTEYTEKGFNGQAGERFPQMLQEGISPDSVTFVCSLKACATLGALETGQSIHADIVKMGLEAEPNVGNAVVDMYGKCCSLAEAHHVHDQLPDKDAISWNALISAFTEHGPVEEVLNSFRQMQLEGITPVSVTFSCSLKACGILKAFETGQQIHIETVKMGYERELYVANTLVDMYGKCGLLPEACQVFGGLCVRDKVTWNALIAAYAEHGLDEKVLDCFHSMEWEGVSVDAVMSVLCLKSCASLGALETGRELHSVISKLGLEQELVVGNMLVDMYGKCGSVAEGRRVFDKLLVRDVVSWNAMIKAYAENHEVIMAVNCFEDMQEQGVKPDMITFTCLLAACSHASLVPKGQDYFRVMRDHEIEPRLDHYACMIDLFGRSGHVYEAERFLTAVQSCPSSTALKVLLSACKTYGKMELGQRCFQQLVEMNQEDASVYLLMADIYAAAGRLSDAHGLEDLRRFAGMKKKAGSVSIEVNKKLHDFVVGVNGSENLLEVLEVLNVEMKDDGFVPNVDLVLKVSP